MKEKSLLPACNLITHVGYSLGAFHTNPFFTARRSVINKQRHGRFHHAAGAFCRATSWWSQPSHHHHARRRGMTLPPLPCVEKLVGLGTRITKMRAVAAWTFLPPPSCLGSPVQFNQTNKIVQTQPGNGYHTVI